MNYSHDQEFLNQAQIKLGCRDVEETRKLIGRVLHVLRDQLSEEASEELLSQLPSDLVLIYLSAWPARPNRLPTRHLDHFVNRVIAYDRQAPNAMFRTEIDALRATLIIFYELDKRYDVLNYLPYTFKHDMKSALINEAA